MFYWQAIALHDPTAMSITDACLHKRNVCICKKRAIDHSGQPLVITANGFDQSHGSRSSKAKFDKRLQNKPYTGDTMLDTIAPSVDSVRECYWKMTNAVLPRFN